MSTLGRIAKGLAAGLGSYLTYQGKQQLDNQELERRMELLSQREMARANLSAQIAEQKAAKEARIKSFGEASLLAGDADTWDRTFGELGKTDPEAAKLVGKFSPEMRNSLAARAGLGKELNDIGRIRYEVMPAGSKLQGFDSSGRPLQDAPSSSSGPNPGDTEGGYQFVGGDPGDPNNWKKVGGPGASAGGRFP